MKSIPDVIVRDHGSVFVFILVSKKAQAWVDKNLQVEAWQWVTAHSFGVDHGLAETVVAMIQDHEEGPGLIVK